MNQFYLILFCCFSKFLLFQWKIILPCTLMQFAAAEFPDGRMSRQLLIPVLFLNRHGYTQRRKFIFQIILHISFSHLFNSSLLHIQPMSLQKAFESILNCEVLSVLLKPWNVLDGGFVRLEIENAIMLVKHFIIFELLQLLNESHSATYRGVYLSCEGWQLLLSLSDSVAFNLLVLAADHKLMNKNMKNKLIP